MSLETASQGAQRIQAEVEQSLRRVNMTDHNLEQLQGLQVSGVEFIVHCARPVMPCNM